MRTNFRVFVVNQTDEGLTMGTQWLRRQDLPPGEVLIQVAYAAMNYKDALVCTAQGKGAQTSPLVPGLELAGRAVESRDKRFTSGDEVMAYDFGSTQDFDGQALVMNGASDFLVEVFGKAGKHIRTAVGVASLPMGFSASVYIIAEVEQVEPSAQRL